MSMQGGERLDSGLLTEKTLRDLPCPRGLPLVGNLHQVRFDRLHLQLEAWAERYGDMFVVRYGPIRGLVISDREAVQRMLIDRPDGFRRPAMIELTASDMRLKGVFAAEGEDWRRQRRIVAGALGRTRLKTLFPQIQVMVGRLKRRWESAADRQEPVDLCRDLMRFTVDVTMQVAFGIDANTLETEGPVIQRHLDKVFPVLNRRVNSIFPYWRIFRLPSDRAMDRALVALEQEVGDMVQATRERMAADPDRMQAPTNFLESILAALAEEGSGFSDEEVFANAGTLLLAGEDTTANSIAWAVHYLTGYPEYFHRARDEVDALVAPGRIIEDPEQAGRLPFVDAFCNEVMRLKPVAPLQILETVTEMDILGCRVPKGTPVTILARHMATRNENFGDGSDFDPDRWLVPPGERHRPHERQAFIPFGAGPRICPGRSLALLEIRMILAMLCRNFDLEAAVAPDEVGERMAFTMCPVNLSVILKRRTGA